MSICTWHEVEYEDPTGCPVCRRDPDIRMSVSPDGDGRAQETQAS